MKSIINTNDMKTKATTVMAVLMLAISIAAIAQPKEGMAERRKQIEAQKVGFITRELNLTPEEAQVFWPVYNQEQEEQRALRKDAGQFRDGPGEEGEPGKTIESMSDKELEAAMDQILQHEQAELDLKRKYLAKYKEVLPIKKVALLYQAERKFRRKLMSDIRDAGQPGERPHRNPGGPGRM